MWLQDIRNTGSCAADPAARAEWRKKQREERTWSLPASWGSDTVSFSPEARAAAQAVARPAIPDQAAASDQAVAVKQNASAQRPDAAEEFFSYMKKTRNRAQGASYEEQIKALQDKLKGRQNSLVQAAAGDAPDAPKSNRVAGINSQINSIMEQIAELSAQAAKEGTES